ncbi:CsbD family protein [Streptomyces beijiangensis]|uniref:CsbD family protein n=2 Tax=Streptomyces beijiangensis TaxID=163361 RepID=A0A939F495_9ACTN|nr:CsbD family protein [Streptomyces beijiangensis]MBO0511154.1 CsbD family protein [Streptomyces beijiangensis]
MGDDNGTFDKLKGKAKEAVGKATGNDRMTGEGKTDQAKGKAKDMVESAKDTLAGAKDSLTGDKKPE